MVAIRAHAKSSVFQHFSAVTNFWFVLSPDASSGIQLRVNGSATLRRGTAPARVKITVYPAREIVESLRQHWPEYLMEAAELATFMVSACLFSVILFHPGSPVTHAIPSAFVRRALMGLAMGLTAVGIAYSPFGQQSGAHFNPAVTLTYWRMSKIKTVDAIFYVLAQFVGGVAGVWISKLTLGGGIANPAVNYAVTAPGPYGTGVAFAAEMLISSLLLLVVLAVSNRKSLTRWTPWFAGSLVALYITFESPVSGMSMNPARTFGSAVIPHAWNSLWVYFTAPSIGMLLAAEVYVRLRKAAPFCAKLHHSNSKRCIFRCAFEQMN